MLSKKELEKHTHQGYDIGLIRRTQPQGGLLQKTNHLVFGDAYVSCIHLYQFPKEPPLFWLATVSANENTIVKYDFQTVSKEVVLKDINKAIEEQRDRSKRERHQTDRDKAADEQHFLTEYARKLNQGREITKLVNIRIFVSAKTQQERDKTVAEYQKTLEGSNFKNVVAIGQQLEEWKALLRSPSQQIDHGGREGVAAGTATIGGGYPFNFQFMIDPFGGFLGLTDTGGVVIWDPFWITKTRKSFNFLLVGNSGFGKSTALKVIEEIAYAKGAIIRGFEKNKDWYKLIDAQNGYVLDLSGSDGMLNPLEPLATITNKEGTHVDELGSYMQHRAGFFTKVKFMDPPIPDLNIQYFQRFLDMFYISKKLLPQDYIRVYKTYQERGVAVPENLRIIGRERTTYPIVEEFYHFLHQEFSKPEYQKATETRKVAIENFLTVIESMATTNGALFNGHTTLPNLDDVRVLFFDIDTLDNFDEPLKRCQLFMAVSLVWRQAMVNGLRMKQLLSAKQITRKAMTFFLFVLDECQVILNEELGTFVPRAILNFQQEMRKFSGGLGLATQSLETFLPSDPNSEYARLMRRIFARCQSKFFLNIDASEIDLTKKALGNLLTSSEYDSLTELEQGQMLAKFGGKETYRVNVMITDEQKELFDGGH